MIRDSQVKFKVSWWNIFQKTKTSRIVIILWAQIYAKVPQTALNFLQKMNKSVYGLLSSKNRIFLVPNTGLPWTRSREGNYSSPRPQLHLTLYFFSQITIKKFLNPDSAKIQQHYSLLNLAIEDMGAIFN